MIQSFVSMGVTTILWYAVGFSLCFGGGGFFVKQCIAILISSVYAFVFTWVMLWVIDRIAKVNTSEAEEGLLDESLHGETAYERSI